MATSSRQEFDMPGYFTPPLPHSRSKSSTDVFAPAPRFATGSETTSGQVIDCTRKRSRHDGNPNLDSNLESSLNSHSSSWADNSLSFSHFSDARSPPPLANDQYALAGGTERPHMFSRHTGDYDDYFYLEKQRGMWSTPTSPQNDISSKAMQSASTSSKPWMLGQILGLVGGVAGRLVQFCSVPFRGFQAGGGQAYSYTPEGQITRTEQQEDPFLDAAPAAMQGSLPGEYPDDDYGVVSIGSLDHERPRMAKRLRTGESWVVVGANGDGNGEEMESRPSTPRLSERRVPNHTRSPSQIPRPMSRASTPSLTPKRPSLIPISRRSALDRKSLHEAPQAPHGAPAARSYSRQSYGSPAMFKDNSGRKTKSPLPPESQRLINKMRHEELEDDARMRRMSSQMSAMLREAQEALGSKFEVHEDEMDMSNEGLSGGGWFGR